MALKDRVNFKITNTLLWRAGFVALGVLCLVFAIIIWASGSYDTRSAASEGRRLLVRLDDGVIEGKQITIEPAQLKPAESPPAGAPPESAAPVPQAAPPESAAVAAATPPAALPAPESPAAATDKNDAIATASVPLAAVKDELTEKSSVGLLPVVAPDGAKAWRYYAKPYERKGHLPMIAIIVTGLGESKAATQDAIRLPENIDLSFTPYARDIDSWANSARIAGHEVLIDLPLEPGNYPAVDPGPEGLLVGNGSHENATRLQWLMSRFAGYIGFLTPQNEVFTTNLETFKTMLESFNNRGLMLVTGRESPKAETEQIIDTTATPNIVADILLDEELSDTAIKARLASLEKIAATRGYAVGIAQAFPITIEQLKAWSAQLEKDGFVLVPVTFIVKLKFPS